MYKTPALENNGAVLSMLMTTENIPLVMIKTALAIRVKNQLQVYCIHRDSSKQFNKWTFLKVCELMMIRVQVSMCFPFFHVADLNNEKSQARYGLRLLPP
ncbi:hypothetical protein RirG_008490 [Rhizophagus irregularis DAOM 197198w]|uniref:Uncharacterized protein n=1 Tax=Rhizophagus irregularis (strain DAOM 197198w) TaxID=1432141 RepID=A0A015MRA4_RHIIW|nr:hypothetical protein RirG_097550 [Rhizophagus irregularis DAOM 197198w]EXX79142.1 hypothetical protein RirG_008490 [Rhizophagus irregularis DAOM 197198w]